MDTTRIYRTHLLLTILMVVFLLHSTICKAQTFIYPQNDSILTEYNDGRFWAYFNKNDFVVGLSCFETKDDYGKYYHLDIFIRNLSKIPDYISQYCPNLYDAENNKFRISSENELTDLY